MTFDTRSPGAADPAPSALDAEVDCITTDTCGGANLGNLGEYGIADWIGELSGAGARIARKAIDDQAGDSAQAGLPHHPQASYFST